MIIDGQMRGLTPQNNTQQLRREKAEKELRDLERKLEQLPPGGEADAIKARIKVLQNELKSSNSGTIFDGFQPRNK